MSFEQQPAEGGITSADMYDQDVVAIREIWAELMRQFSRKPNDHLHIAELEKRATDALFLIGYTCRVHTSECLLGIGPAVLEVTGRVAGHEVLQQGLDHERKGWEINRAVSRAEDQDVRGILRAIEPPVPRSAKDQGKLIR